MPDTWPPDRCLALLSHPLAAGRTLVGRCARKPGHEGAHHVMLTGTWVEWTEVDGGVERAR